VFNAAIGWQRTFLKNISRVRIGARGFSICPGDWEIECARFGVDAGTVQRISRPFEGASAVVV